MIESIASDVVNRSKIDWQDKQKKAWDRERHLAIEYEKDRAQEDYMRYVSDKLQKQLPTPSNNITRRVNDRVSLVYMVPPSRTLGTNEREYDPSKYNEVTKTKDISLQGCERKTNLLGLIGTKLTWRNDQIDYEKLIDFEPFFDKDPLRPVAVMFPLASNDSVSDTNPQKWQYWDENVWATYADGKLVDEGENNYGVIPVAWSYRELPDGSFLDADVDRGLIFANRELNVLQLDGDANIRFRSFGEMWAQGLNEDTTLEKDPAVIHSLPEGASISTTSPEDTISSVKDWIRQIYTFVAQNHHLPVDFVEGAVIASGVAIEARNKELNDDRRSDVERWRLVEHEIYKIEREMCRVEASMDLPKEFAVDFQESIDEVLTPAEQRAEDDWMLEHNMTTDAQILMRDNPDKYETEEAAQKAIEENNAKNKVGNAPIPTFANALAEPVDGDNI